jgi:uncharacterized protein YecA (UPF0149 family)
MQFQQEQVRINTKSLKSIVNKMVDQHKALDKQRAYFNRLSCLMFAKIAHEFKKISKEYPGVINIARDDNNVLVREFCTGSRAANILFKIDRGSTAAGRLVFNVTHGARVTMGDHDIEELGKFIRALYFMKDKVCAEVVDAIIKAEAHK